MIFACKQLPVLADDEPNRISFVHDRLELTRLFPDAAIDTLPGGCMVVTPASYSAPTPEVDPRYKWTLTRAVYVFAPRQEGQATGLFRLVTVHHEPELRDQARHSGCLIGRLWTLYSMHFRREISFPLQSDTADVYLTPEAAANGVTLGGETHNDSIYIFRAGIAARTPLEWVRTIAHEWGHLTLPAARGYRDPEGDASGYLGERLSLKWMCADETVRPANAPDDGTTAGDLNRYCERQVKPLIQRYLRSGPGSATVDGDDTNAMDYYIGSVLAADDAFGSAVTGRALYTVVADRARDFLIALRQYLQNKPTFTVNAPAWVPFSKGEYRLVTAGSPSSAAATLRVSVTGWRKILPPGKSPTITVSRLFGTAP